MIAVARATALALVLVLACSRRHDAATEAGSAASAVTPPADAAPPRPFPLRAPELITGVVDDWSSTTVALALWYRTGTGWERQYAWDGRIGKAGAAWGDGLHGSGAPPNRTGPVKQEGDKASPAGAFLLRAIYGYSQGAVSHLSYTPTSRDWLCIDDPKSSHYGEILDRTRVATPDWSTAEAMYRDDDDYQWVIDVAHNAKHRPGAGSCIFLHMMQPPGHTTVGCTAMEEIYIARLIAALEPGAVYVLLPRAEYAALQAAWGLPQL